MLRSAGPWTLYIVYCHEGYDTGPLPNRCSRSQHQLGNNFGMYRNHEDRHEHSSATIPGIWKILPVREPIPNLAGDEGLVRIPCFHVHILPHWYPILHGITSVCNIERLLTYGIDWAHRPDAEADFRTPRGSGLEHRLTWSRPDLMQYWTGIHG